MTRSPRRFLSTRAASSWSRRKREGLLLRKDDRRDIPMLSWAAKETNQTHPGPHEQPLSAGATQSAA
jgi:hypothetical protein